MTDKTLSKVAGGGGSGFIFPHYIAPSGRIALQSNGSAVKADSLAFWTAVSLSKTLAGYETDRLTGALDTTEQTIVDISGGGGILTQIISPRITSGTLTIRVTTDGNLETFTVVIGATTARVCMGDIVFIKTSSTLANSSGQGSTSDTGFDDPTSTSRTILYSTPTWAVAKKIGMPFEESLKVTIQSSVALTDVGNYDNEMGCNYLNTLPLGVL